MRDGHPFTFLILFCSLIKVIKTHPQRYQKTCSRVYMDRGDKIKIRWKVNQKLK